MGSRDAGQNPEEKDSPEELCQGCRALDCKKCFVVNLHGNGSLLKLDEAKLKDQMQVLAPSLFHKRIFLELTLLTRYGINLNKNLTFFWLHYAKSKTNRQKKKTTTTIVGDN